MAAKAIDRIAKALDDAGTVAETAEQRARRALDEHLKFRTSLQAAIPEVAGYLERLDVFIDVLMNPLSTVWQKNNARAAIGSIEWIVEMFDQKDLFWLNDYIASKLGKNLSQPSGTPNTSKPGSTSGGLRNPFPQPPRPPSTDVAPTARTKPPKRRTPQRPNSSTGRYRT